MAIGGALYRLSQNPESQERVMAEIRARFRSLDEIRPGEALSACEALTRTIREVLRRGPPIPGCFWRLLVQDTVIDGQLIPSGYEVGVCQYAMHHSADNFAHPFEFDPERFRTTTEGDQSPTPAKAFYPFSIGRRACPVKGFAERIISMSLARIIWSTDFRLAVADPASSCALAEGKKNDSGFQFRDAFVAQQQGLVLEFRRREDVSLPW